MNQNNFNILKHETLLPNTNLGLLLWSIISIITFGLVNLIPIATHLNLLAIFGLAHVLIELRYVDGQFSSRLMPIVLKGIALMIMNIVMVRGAINLGYISASIGVGMEIAFGAGLVSLAIASCSHCNVLINTLMFLFTAFAIASPLHALVILAFLHNLTPLGFLAEALPNHEISTVMWRLSIVFFVVPIVIATGIPHAISSTIITLNPAWVPMNMENNFQHLGAFLPPEIIQFTWAINVFAAAVFAQAMHYLAVIVVLPRVANTRQLIYTPFIPWPHGLALFAIVGTLSMILGIYFVLDYPRARMIYGILAAIHSWIEIPILIIAFGGIKKAALM